MRALGVVLAVVALVVALLLAPWALIPILAGLLAGAAIWFEVSNKPWAVRWIRRIKAVALAAAVGAIVWFAFDTPWKPQPTSVATRANRLVTGLVQPAAPADGAAVATDDLDRLNLREAMQDERRKLALIAQAPSLYEAARKTNLRQTSSEGPDEKLAAALREFQAQFEKDREKEGENDRPSGKGKPVRLLAPEALQAHVKSAAAAIDRLENEGLAGNRSSQELRNFRHSIPDRLNDFQIDALFGTVAALQEQLRSSLKLQLAMEPTYTVRYERTSDSLVAEQAVRLRLADNTASEIDLTGLLSVTDGKLGAHLSEVITVKADAREEERIDGTQPRYKLPPGVRELVVTKKVTRTHAAEPLFNGWLPVQFTQVRVDWPIGREHGVTISLKPGNSGEEWPLVVPLKYTPEARLGNILVPKYATHFVEPAMEIKVSADHDQLDPGDKAGRLRTLSAGPANAIRVELLPWFLSNPIGQTIKPYLAAESLLAALVFFVITVWGAAALKPSGR